MKSKFAIFMLVAIVTLDSANTMASDKSPAELQKEKVLEYWNQVKKAELEKIEAMISAPPPADEMMCLDQIRGVDLSVFTVDMTGAWDALYKKLKDQIYNQVCSAANDWVTEQTAMLETNMEAPLGLAGITITQSNDVADWQSELMKDVTIDASDLESYTSQVGLGEVDPIAPVSGDTSKLNGTNVQIKSRSFKAETEKLKEMLDAKSLWKDKKND